MTAATRSVLPDQPKYGSSWFWQRPECRGAHKTGPIIWPGTAHQHVVCEKCRRRLSV